MEQVKTAEDIAVIGFALKFPGDANSPDAFWKLLLEGKSAMTDVPKERFNLNSFGATKGGKDGKITPKGGNFIRDDISAFDAPFFSINPAEAKCMDPQQRLLLETAYHSLENSGETLESVRGSETAVYVGSFMRDYEIMMSKDAELPAKYRITGTSVAMLANRLSWFYDLRGPSVAVDTACSSSLTALHLACQNLRAGEATMGLVAGSNLVFGPESSIGLSDMNFLSPDSKCYSFDNRANGYSRGEGIGVVVIKIMSQALKDGNTIRAVIRATGTNQDGKTAGITNPSSEAQENLIRQTYQKAGLDMAATRYFEAHGTGTSVGDPVEAKAIANAFKGLRALDDPMYIGAVKSNIGHLEGGSGVAGLIKIIMVLENGVIPPNINFEKVNPKIPIDIWNIKFPTAATPWPTNGLRRASLNSFGIGGANAHAILDDALHYFRERNIVANHLTQTVTPQTPEGITSVSHTNGFHSTDEVIANGNSGTNGHKETNGSHSLTNGFAHLSPTSQQKLIVWSSFDENSLTRLINSFESHLTNEAPDSIIPQVKDIAYTLSEKRSLLAYKSYLVVDSKKPSWPGISTNTSKPIRSLKSPTAGFIFTGQGAQYYGMGSELITYPIFRKSLEDADLYLKELGASWSVIDELLHRDKTSSKLDSPEYGQPLTTILQVALVDLLNDWGITPSVVVGHSSGEIAAAYCAGAISKEAAWKLSYFRGTSIVSALQVKNENGAMISVGISADEAEKYFNKLDLAGHPTIACINSPRNVTLSGLSSDMSILQEVFEKEGIFCRKLRVDVAYHSKYMDLAGSIYKPLIKDLQPGKTKGCVMISSVTGKPIDGEALLEPEYWVRNLVSTVRFSEAVSQISSKPMKKQLGQKNVRQFSATYLVEVGPHSTLQGPIRDILSSVGRVKDIEYGSLLVRGKSSQATICEAMGKLHCHGFSVSILKVNEPIPEACKMLVNLPSYPFNHATKYWLESRVSKNFRFGDIPYHELLGSRVADWNPLEARWQNRLTLSDKSWIKDHVVNGVVLFPGVGLLVMAIEAARQLSFESSPDKKIEAYRLKDVSFFKGLVVPPESEGVEIQLFLRPYRDADVKNEQSWNEFRIFFFEDEQWAESCRGAIMVEHESELGEVGAQRIVEEADRYSYEYHEGAALCKEALSHKKLYDTFAHYGYNYGPSFRLLQNSWFSSESHDITSDINLDEWKSTISENDIQPHLIHPTVIDCLLQLSFPSMNNGCTTTVPTFVPSRLNDLWISNLDTSVDRTINVHMKGAYRGNRGTSGVFRAVHASTGRACIAGEFETTFVSSEVRSTMDDRASAQKYYNLDWKPDTSLLEKNQITSICSEETDSPIPFSKMMVEEKELLCHLAIARTLGRIEGKMASDLPEHLLRYVEWMRHQKVVQTDDENLERLLSQVEECDADGAVIARAVRNLDKILMGEVDPLELLFKDKLLEPYYIEAHDTPFVMRKLARYVDALAHKNPALKVLEIGAGTGSATTYMLDALMHHGEHEAGAHRFSNYVFTDISPTFFENAREKFKNDRMSFKVLDIEKDPLATGLEAGTFDLIIASNVLHATSDIEQTMRNTHKLLKSGGKLVMLEITNPNILRIALIFGLLPGWWRAIEGYRTWGPTMETHRWNEVLRNSQFSGVEVAFSNQETMNDKLCSLPVSGIVSTALPISPTPTNGINGANHANGTQDAVHLPDTRVVIVADDSSDLEQKVSTELHNQLTDIGFQCSSNSTTSINSCDLQDKFCIFLPEISKSWFQCMNEDKYKDLKRVISESRGLLWVFHQETASSQGPDRQAIIGFSRSVQSESDNFKFVTLGLDDISSPAKVSGYVTRIFEASLADKHSTEMEYLVKKEVINIPRVVEANYISEQIAPDASDASALQLVKQTDRPLRLTIGSVGLLDTLRFVDDEKFSRPMDADEVEIEVKAAGINFRDILIALGQLPVKDIGSECAGIVTRLGSAARESFKVGDRVVCAMKGAYRTYGRCRASCVVKLPTNIDFVTGAAFPIAFATAYYALMNLARVRKGESVLIHAGAGGFGQAAIQIGKLCEAVIYVTVSTDAKKQLLMRLYDIPEDHFFSSRTLAFKDGIMRITKGKGVDVVVNSLSGEALRCSWECIAYFGRFIEIGKRDILAPSVSALGGLPMSPFAKNTTFASVDLTLVFRLAPDLAQQLLASIMDLAEAGKISVPQPLNVFSAAQIEEAFRFMQGGKHTGKCIVEFGDQDRVQVSPPVKRAGIFDPEATYIIAGGLGGIGQSIAKWMVARNAKHLVLLSRRKVYSDQTLGFLESLKAKGIDVYTPPCDVADLAVMKEVIATCAGRMPPIRGCIQGSMVLKSAMYSNMSFDDFQASVKPKIEGSWILHTLLPSGLDFFIMLSSYTGIVGALGQSNYAAGNTYQDGLARYRVSIGEKAVAIDLGMVESVGFVAEHEDIQGFLKAGGHQAQTEAELHNLLGYYCNPKLNIQPEMKSQIITGLPLPATLKAKNIVQLAWLSRPLFQQLHEIEIGDQPMLRDSSGSVDLESLLAATTTLSEVTTIISDALRTKLASLLMIEKDSIDPEKPIHTLGVDSLVAVEIRNWFNKVVDADVAIFNILGHGSLSWIGLIAAEKSRLVPKALKGPSIV